MTEKQTQPLRKLTFNHKIAINLCKIILKFLRKGKRPRITYKLPKKKKKEEEEKEEKEKKVGGLTLSFIKIYYRTTVT